MIFQQNVFEGEIPKIAPHLLPVSKGVFVENVKLFSGDMVPFKDALLDSTVSAGTDTIYQYRDDSGTFWFEWQGDVDVIESPVANDPNNRIYYSGAPGGLRWTDNIDGLSSSPYPANDKTLVFNPPTDNPLLIAGAEPPDVDPFTPEIRSYVYTFVTSDGWESSPSPLSTISNIYPGQTVAITIDSDPGTVDLNIVYTRIYRTTPSGVWQFVTQLSIGVTNYIDAIATENLGEVLPTQTWLPADNDIIGLIVNDSGSAIAFKNNELWISESYVLYAYPLAYRLSISGDIVSIKASAQSIYIATSGQPYVAIGVRAGEYQLIKIDEDLPCLSKRSMVDAGERAFYASTDGIVMFEGTTAKLITQNIIESRDWFENYDPTNLKGVWFDGRIYYFGATTSFIFNPDGSDIVHLDFGSPVIDAFNSLEENVLYILTGTDIYKFDSGVGFMTMTYRSRDMITSPGWFSSLKIDADEYSDVTFELYEDDTLVHTTSVLSNDFVRLPTARYRKHSWKIIGTSEIRGVTLASTGSELSTFLRTKQVEQ